MSSSPAHARHAKRVNRSSASRSARSSRLRLLVVVLAPVAVLAPLVAQAAAPTHNNIPASTTGHTSAVVHHAVPAKAKAAAVTSKHLAWSRSWSPSLALLSDYSKSQPSSAGFKALPLSYHTRSWQLGEATATFKTRWVDVKALVDGPNISQQGLSIQPEQYKLQIMHGATPASHRANCHISGTTGHVLAFGPSIDVADGRWHTVSCIKYPDTAKGTKVVVIVDGIAGKAAWSRTPIGDVLPTGEIRLGGRSAKASSDSLDGWIRSVGFWLAG
jgi:hypothetical protein